MKLEKAEKLVNRKVSYINFNGTIEKVWNLQDKMTLAKVKAGDTSYIIVNIEILNIEAGDSRVVENVPQT